MNKKNKMNKENKMKEAEIKRFRERLKEAHGEDSNMVFWFDKLMKDFATQQPEVLSDSVTIPLWKFKKIADAIRLTINIYYCDTKKTAYDRTVMEANNFIINHLQKK